MKNKLLQNTLVAAVAVASIGQALADGGKIVTHRDLAQTKAEAIRRAEQSIYPLSAMNAEDVRATVAGIQSLERDEWAAAFIRAGARSFCCRKSLCRCPKTLLFRPLAGTVGIEATPNSLCQRACGIYGGGEIVYPPG